MKKIANFFDLHAAAANRAIRQARLWRAQSGLHKDPAQMAEIGYGLLLEILDNNGAKTDDFDH